MRNQRFGDRQDFTMVPVVLLTPTAAPGGAERALASLARHLPDAGFAPTLISLEPGAALPWFEAVGCPVEVVGAGRVRDLPRALGTVRRVRRRVRAVGAVCVVNNQTKGQLYGGLAARGVAPTIFWQHGVPGRDPLDRLTARVPTTAIVCTTAAAVAAQQRLTPRADIRRVPPGIDLDAIRDRRGSGGQIRRQLGVPPGGLLVGIVGRLQEWKGQRTFLEAAEQVLRDHPSTRFVVVGGAVLGWEDPTYETSLHAFVRERQLGGAVHLVGHQDDVAPWFDALDIVVHASFNEPFGLVIVEGMALGKPVIAAHGAGPDEIAHDGVDALLFDPGDPHALAQQLSLLIGDASLRERIARAGAANAERFDERRMAREMVQVVREVANLRAR